MVSKVGFIVSPNGEDALRFAGILNAILGMSLSFIGLRAVYIVLGTTIGVSLLFNFVMILAQGHETRIKLKNNQPVRPSLFALGTEFFGTGALLVMYVISLVDTVEFDGSWWNGGMILIHAYSGLTGLIACILHGCLATKRTAQYLNYCRSLSQCCPHCKRAFDAKLQILARDPSPLALSPCEAHSPRGSFAANTTGEGENDNLIMKE
ncbi:uncharacterized protein A1O9_07865 [Exophiala aquamarina CBS 119918]|uniref:Uncharacterized protein n=1 Tax=Exophiala aquamarina CBS 119918 TaxID=1182545 RepID=A0A072P890_9EURO|nr:uncharacterized protein A1O9_07865 [Exophiala aquamarina CBS 119918]KEF56284.1 hypothetical protein A1O9_07865 [Exophiala aquamarina CBS 119918]